MPYEALMAETAYMHGHRGDLIDAYLARPLGSTAVLGDYRRTARPPAEHSRFPCSAAAASAHALFTG
jgi:hypothetical protein